MCWHAAVLGLAAGGSQILQQGCRVREELLPKEWRSNKGGSHQGAWIKHQPGENSQSFFS